MKAEILRYKDLTESERDDVGGDEENLFLKVTNGPVTVLLQSDYMETEDARFNRDMRWIPAALLQCYEIGKLESGLLCQKLQARLDDQLEEE